MTFLIRIFTVTFAILIGAAVGYTQNTNNATSTPAKPNNHIKVKYNQAKNETTVILKTLALSNSMNKEFTRESEFGNLDLDISFSYSGRQISNSVDAAVFKFKGTSRNQLWQHGQNLVAVIDDSSAVVLGATNYSSNSQTFYFEEVMSISVPYAAMKRIASAKTLALQLGTRNIRISNDQLEDLRAVAALMAR